MIKARPATEADRDAINEILNEAGSAEGTNAESGEELTVLADARSCLAGICRMALNAGSAELTALYVREDFLHKSLEERMLGCAVEMLKTRGISALTARADAFSPAALKRLGFVEAGGAALSYPL